jgi:hypothetical protein
MQFEARVFIQLGSHVGRFVGCVVVEHQMDSAPRWHGLADVPEEFQELLGPLSWFASKPREGNG